MGKIRVVASIACSQSEEEEVFLQASFNEEPTHSLPLVDILRIAKVCGDHNEEAVEQAIVGNRTMSQIKKGEMTWTYGCPQYFNLPTWMKAN